LAYTTLDTVCSFYYIISIVYTVATNNLLRAYVIQTWRNTVLYTVVEASNNASDSHVLAEVAQWSGWRTFVPFAMVAGLAYSQKLGSGNYVGHFGLR